MELITDPVTNTYDTTLIYRDGTNVNVGDIVWFSTKKYKNGLYGKVMRISNTKTTLTLENLERIENEDKTFLVPTNKVYPHKNNLQLSTRNVYIITQLVNV
jgi:hypothetical protein